MNTVLRAPLQTTESQTARLLELQEAFSKACNALAPVAQQTKCWNRVALHHMAYKALRQQFPVLGSQMVCNAIYSVSRACRLVYQHPRSPFNLQRLSGKGLPLVQFTPRSPVYFDRHTLSLKDGQVSLFTLDGRMRFRLALDETQAQRFRTEKLREIVLTSAANQFTLSFRFAEGDDREPADDPLPDSEHQELPEYMLIIEDPAALPPVLNAPLHAPLPAPLPVPPQP